MKLCRERVFILIAAILLCSLPFIGSASPITSITISLGGEVKTININQSNAPLIIHGSVGYEGISIRPVTITLEPYCDVGEVVLTQYEFVFHLPDTIPFDAFIYIAPETENDTVGTLTLNGYYSEGGIQQSINAVSQIFYVLNYGENETPSEKVELKKEEINLFLVGFPIYLLISIIFILAVSRKSDKEIKNSKPI